jgi:putative colanic acid biosynthesis UDP-glucose lipid carrier transferase
MFEDRAYKRTFYSAPQSVTSLVAALLEPTIIVAMFVLASMIFEEPIERPGLTLCLLVFALTFPGRNRFHDNLIGAAVDITLSWFSLLAVLALFGYATRSLKYFDTPILMTWALATPAVQWAAVSAGAKITRMASTRPTARRSAVVVGAGPLGVKVARALAEATETGIDVIGYFDDRMDERLHNDAIANRLGGLREVGPYVIQNGVRNVFITLPLGSQPRIVEFSNSFRGPQRRSSSCPMCSASASSRAGFRI